MNEREQAILLSLLAKANPPPLLHRYRRPSEWTIKEIENCELHAAGPGDMNDPFEYRAPIEIDLEKLKARFVDFAVTERGLSKAEAAQESEDVEMACAELRRRMAEVFMDGGVICFSDVPDSVRMWSYYADCHRGVCIGYRSDRHPLFLAMKVRYEDPGPPLELMEALALDPTMLAEHVSLRKSAEWAFEREFRLPIGPIGNRTRLLPLAPNTIVEVRFGARITDDFRDEVMEALGRAKANPRLIQMGCDYDRFVLTETEVPLGK